MVVCWERFYGGVWGEILWCCVGRDSMVVCWERFYGGVWGEMLLCCLGRDTMVLCGETYYGVCSEVCGELLWNVGATPSCLELDNQINNDWILISNKL